MARMRRVSEERRIADCNTPSVSKVSGFSVLVLGESFREPAVPPSGVRSSRGACDYLAGADDHGRERRPGDGRVEHLAAQEEGAARRMRDDHADRELDALAAMDRTCIGEA